MSPLCNQSGKKLKKHNNEKTDTNEKLLPGEGAFSDISKSMLYKNTLINYFF
jgi:hypothetical protein